jgi:methionyl-tRNA formyltransferase
VRRIRAVNPWPVAETKLAGAQLRIWEAEPGPEAGSAPPGTVLRATHDGIDVACGDGILRVLRLQLAGRKPLAAQEFIKAQPLAGARFASV